MSSVRCSTLVLIAGAFLIIARWSRRNGSRPCTSQRSRQRMTCRSPFRPTATSYGSDDPIPMKYKIANISGRPVFVPQTTEKLLCPPVSHVTAWFESADGHYGGGRFGRRRFLRQKETDLTQRMNTGAVFLKPGEHMLGGRCTEHQTIATRRLSHPSNLSAWKPEEFSPTEQAELATMGAAVLRGEVPASAKVTLTSAPPPQTATPSRPTLRRPFRSPRPHCS